MGFLSGFLTEAAEVFTIDTSVSTSTGQPTETLVSLETIKVFFQPNLKRERSLFGPGMVKVGEFSAISEKSIAEGTVVEINSVKYRVVASNAVKFKKRTFLFSLSLDLYQH